MGGVVVIHHMPGYDAGHKEITRRLATRSAARRCARTCIRARLLAPTPTTLPPPPAPGVECRPTGSWVTSRAASTLSGPLLGLFGNEDAHPSPADVDELDRRLTELGKVHEFHRYDGAGHAFFTVDRPSYRPAAASAGWLRVRDFLARHLAS